LATGLPAPTNIDAFARKQNMGWLSKKRQISNAAVDDFFCDAIKY